MNTPATITAPEALPERDTYAQLLAVEDAAYSALTGTHPLTEGQALDIWEASQRYQTRDPLITRLLTAHPARRAQILPRLETVIARMTAPDAELLTVAGVLTWAIRRQRDDALRLLGLAIDYQPEHSTSQLAELMATAIEIGAAPDVWLTACAGVPLASQRLGTA